MARKGLSWGCLLAVAVLAGGCQGVFRESKPSPGADESVVPGDAVPSVGVMVRDPLAKAAKDAAAALASLSRVETTRTPPPPVPEGPGPADLQTRITIDWVGPLEGGVRQVADAAGFVFRVAGDRPAGGVTVDLRHRGETVFEVLKDAGVQAGRMATVAVNPQEKVIEVRYDGARR